MQLREPCPYLQIVWADSGPLVFGLDEIIERRVGLRIAAKGNVPGRGAVLAPPFCQGHGIALDQPNVAYRDPVGGTGLGPALACDWRSWPSCAWSQYQRD